MAWREPSSSALRVGVQCRGLPQAALLIYYDYYFRREATRNLSVRSVTVKAVWFPRDSL